jgi:Carboxypeptidase regulatory-like domain
MKRLVLVIFAFMALGFAKSAFCAEIIGEVADAQGTPVTNVDIAVSDASGKTVRTVRLDQKGIFAISGLTPGEYQVILHPAESGSLGGILQFHLGSSGVTFIWRIRSKQSSLVLAPGSVSPAPGARPIASSLA